MGRGGGFGGAGVGAVRRLVNICSRLCCGHAHRHFKLLAGMRCPSQSAACAACFARASSRYAMVAIATLLLSAWPSGLSVRTRPTTSAMQIDTGEIIPVISSPRSSSTLGGARKGRAMSLSCTLKLLCCEQHALHKSLQAATPTQVYSPTLSYTYSFNSSFSANDGTSLWKHLCMP